MAEQPGTRFTGIGRKQHKHQCSLISFLETEHAGWPDDHYVKDGSRLFIVINRDDILYKWTGENANSLRIYEPHRDGIVGVLSKVARVREVNPTVNPDGTLSPTLISGIRDRNGGDGGGWQIQFRSADFANFTERHLTHEEHHDYPSEQEWFASHYLGDIVEGGEIYGFTFSWP